jgi:hypothetical protein
MNQPGLGVVQLPRGSTLLTSYFCVWRAPRQNDTLAPIADTEELARGIEAVGGHSRLDILPKRDHFILDVYDRSDIYQWLLQQTRESRIRGL